MLSIVESKLGNRTTSYKHCDIRLLPRPTHRLTLRPLYKQAQPQPWLWFFLLWSRALPAPPPCPRGLLPIDIAFIDGNHAFQDVRHDFLATLQHSRRNTYILLHDTNLYLRELLGHAGVKRWVMLAQKAGDCVEVIDFSFSSGVALVRVVTSKAWKRIQRWPGPLRPPRL